MLIVKLGVAIFGPTYHGLRHTVEITLAEEASQ